MATERAVTIDTGSVTNANPDFKVIIIEHPNPEDEEDRIVSVVTDEEDEADVSNAAVRQSERLKNKDVRSWVEKKTSIREKKEVAEVEYVKYTSAPVTTVVGFNSQANSSQICILQVLRHNIHVHRLLATTFKHPTCSRTCTKLICLLRQFTTANFAPDLMGAALTMHNKHFHRLTSAIFEDISDQDVDPHFFYMAIVYWLSQIYDIKTMEETFLLKIKWKDTCLSCQSTRVFPYRFTSLCVPAEKLASGMLTFDLNCLVWGQVLDSPFQCSNCSTEKYERNLQIVNAPKTLVIEVVERKVKFRQSPTLLLPTCEGKAIYLIYAAIEGDKLVYLQHSSKWWVYNDTIVKSTDWSEIKERNFDLLFCQKVGISQLNSHRGKNKKKKTHPASPGKSRDEDDITEDKSDEQKATPFIIGGKLVKLTTDPLSDVSNKSNGEVTNDNNRGKGLHGDIQDTGSCQGDANKEDDTEHGVMQVKLNDIKAMVLLQQGQKVPRYLKNPLWENMLSTRKHVEGDNVKTLARRRLDTVAQELNEAAKARKQCTTSNVVRASHNNCPIPIPVNGLTNVSFMIVVLHIFRLSRALRYVILVRKHHKCQKDSFCGFCCMLNLIYGRDLGNTVHSLFTSLITLYTDKSKAAEEDSRVFYIRLIQSLRECMVSYLFQDTFVATLSQTTVCEECMLTKVSQTMIYYMVLKVKRSVWSLTHSINDYFGSHTIRQQCTKCGDTTVTKSKCKLAGPPRNLIMCTSNVLCTVTTKVSLVEYVVIPAGNAQALYDLYALIYVKEYPVTKKKMFTLCIRHKMIWYHICHDLITRITWQQIEDLTSVPYMLFFEKVKETPNSNKRGMSQDENTIATAVKKQRRGQTKDGTASTVPGRATYYGMQKAQSSETVQLSGQNIMFQNAGKILLKVGDVFVPAQIKVEGKEDGNTKEGVIQRLVISPDNDTLTKDEIMKLFPPQKFFTLTPEMDSVIPSMVAKEIVVSNTGPVQTTNLCHTANNITTSTAACTDMQLTTALPTIPNPNTLPGTSLNQSWVAKKPGPALPRTPNPNTLQRAGQRLGGFGKELRVVLPRISYPNTVICTSPSHITVAKEPTSVQSHCVSAATSSSDDAIATLSNKTSTIVYEAECAVRQTRSRRLLKSDANETATDVTDMISNVNVVASNINAIMKSTESIGDQSLPSIAPLIDNHDMKSTDIETNVSEIPTSVVPISNEGLTTECNVQPKTPVVVGVIVQTNIQESVGGSKVQPYIHEVASGGNTDTIVIGGSDVQTNIYNEECGTEQEVVIGENKQQTNIQTSLTNESGDDNYITVVNDNGSDVMYPTGISMHEFTDTIPLDNVPDQIMAEYVQPSTDSLSPKIEMSEVFTLSGTDLESTEMQQQQVGCMETISLPTVAIATDGDDTTRGNDESEFHEISVKGEQDEAGCFMDYVTMETDAMERDAVTEWVVTKTEDGNEEIRENYNVATDIDNSEEIYIATEEENVMDGEYGSDIVNQTDADLTVRIKAEPDDEDNIFTCIQVSPQIKTEDT